jgi:hypothetical protein
MSRIMGAVLVVGLALMALGMVIGTSQWGATLVVVGAVVLAGFYFVAMAKARHTKGYTWDVNPGAARREARREREAREREAGHTKDP